jgi:hypothetical protein
MYKITVTESEEKRSLTAKLLLDTLSEKDENEEFAMWFWILRCGMIDSSGKFGI